MARTVQDAKEKNVRPGKSSANADVGKIMSVLVSGADRKAYLIVDGEVTFETPINVLNPDQPIGTHLFSLIGPSPDGHALSWSAFGLGGHPQDGVVVDLWSNSVLARIEYLDGDGVRRVARTLHPGTTMVVTDLAASPETCTTPDFTVIAEDMQTPGKRRKR